MAFGVKGFYRCPDNQPFFTEIVLVDVDKHPDGSY